MSLLKSIITHKKARRAAINVCKRTCISCPPPREPIVTIIDASCKIGKNVALLLKQNPHIGELRLYDKNSNVCGIAEDLSHIDTKTRVSSFGGSSVLKHAVLDADIVVAVGGCRSSHKESVKRLFDKNIDDVRIATLHLVEFNPKAVFLIAKPPIEAFVPLVSEEYKKAGVYDNRKIIGITTVATMRANYYIADATGQNAADVQCPIVGGLSPGCVVGVISQSRPDAGLHQQHLTSVQKTLEQCEDDILKVYADCGKICITPALGIARFINMLLKAMKGDTTCVDCAFVRQTGHIGHFLPYMASIVRLGRHGVMSSHMPKVNGAEAHLLKKASYLIQKYIHMGETFVTGEFKVDKVMQPTVIKECKREKPAKAKAEKRNE